jgi:hypothetical protein
MPATGALLLSINGTRSRSSQSNTKVFSYFVNRIRSCKTETVPVVAQQEQLRHHL